jgi:glycosyltransferase involved in cell wall biosynthesis
MDPQKGIKIMHVIDSSGLYGAEVMLLGLMDEQRRMGDRPVLCSIGTFDDGRKEIECAAEQHGHDVIPARMAPGFNLRGAFAILRNARDHKADVLHSHGYKGNILLGSLTRKLRRFPMVSTVHGWTSMGNLSKMRVYDWLDSLSLNGVDAVITVNNSQQHSSKFRWCINKNVRCIPNGIAAAEAAELPSPSDNPVASFCKGHFIVGALGRLSKEKGYDVLIQAFHRLRNTTPDARLVIIGEGKERASLEALIKRLDLEAYVLMPGFMEQAAQYLPLFSCFVISSYTEGLPISLLEAMMAGTPVVSTDVGSIADILETGKTGALVKTGDIEGLSEAMLRICRNPSLAAQQALAAGEIVVSKYSAKNMALAYREVYTELMLPI